MFNDCTASDNDSNSAQVETNNDEQAYYFFELGKYYYELAIVQFDVEDQFRATESCKLAYDFFNKSLAFISDLNREEIEEYLSTVKGLIEQNNKQQAQTSVSRALPEIAAIFTENSRQEHHEETKTLAQPIVVKQLPEEDVNLQASLMHQAVTQLANLNLETKEQDCNSQLSERQLSESFGSLSLGTTDEDRDALVKDAATVQSRSSIMQLRPLDSAWDEDQKLFTDVHRKGSPIEGDATISLIDLEPADANFKFVLDLFNYSKQQSEKQGLLDFSRVKIKKICLINNPHYQEQFEKEIYLLSQRKGNPVFAPKWESMSKDELINNIRKKVAKIFSGQVAKYSDPRLNFLPIWHGSSLDALASILKTGFANLATTDLGYYGKGIYGTTSAEYAKRVYGGGYNADGILLLNWIGVNSALMVAGMGDLELLKGRGNYANYDAHFIPVVPRNQYMHKLGKEDVYFPLQLEKDFPVYNEIVVFGRQILARYVVYTECESIAPTNNLKSDMGLRRLSVEETLDQDRLLKNINHNPWVAINYSLLSQLLKNNQTVKLPKKAEDHVIARLRGHLLPQQHNEQYDAISLCQIALYLDENCVSAYYNLANALRKKLMAARKIFLAFPINQYYSPQELYQAALERSLKSSLTQPLVEKISRSRCLAKLAQSTTDRAIAKEKALEAISVASKDPLAWIALGTTLLPNESILIPNSCDPKCFSSFNAKDIFKEALKLSPKSAEALLGLAKLVQPGEERVEINGKILNFQELLIMALDTEPDDLEIIEELFNLYDHNKQQASSTDILVTLRALLKKIWPYYHDCSKVWELISYCAEPNEMVTLGDNHYTHKQLIEEAFRLDPANSNLYKMLLDQDPTINFDFLLQKMQGNYNVACKKIQQELDLYVPILASAIDPSYGQVNEEQLLPLEQYVQEYVTSPNSQILWIQGYSGSGKSLFARHLEKVLWEQYPHTKQIPLLSSSKENFLKNALQEQGFAAKEIAVLEEGIKARGIKLILIIDNYRGEEPDLSLAVDQLYVILSPQPPLPKIINYYYLVPFSDQQIRKYLYNYVQNPSYNKGNWSINRYEYALDYFQVRDLCKDPFLLKLILQVMPEFLSFAKHADQKELVTSKIDLQKLTKFKVYEEFIKVWIQQKFKVSKHYKKYKDSIEPEVLTNQFAEFSQDLAWELLIRQQHELVWNSEDQLEMSLGRFFESLSKKQRRILKICHEVLPIIFKENAEQSIYSCSFVHSSFRDYFVAKKIVVELANFSAISGIITLNYSILAENNIRSLVVEQIEKEATLQDQLIKIINLSKSSEEWSKAAANAITILNQAGMSFTGLDFTDIKVPNADLSGAKLDHTTLANANLTKVKLKGAWLSGAKLHGSNMKGAYFGEKAYKQIEPTVNCYTYSAGHEYFAEARGKKLIIYKVDLATNSMGSCKTLFIADDYIVSLTFSVNCKLLALVDSAGKITVLDLIGANEPVILIGNNIAFSRDSKYLAFVSSNNTINIYGLSDGKENKIFTEHAGAIRSINFSPDGKNLVSGGDDGNVYIYDIAGNTSTKIGMHNNIGVVRSVCYSTDLKWLGSCGNDKIIYLWNLTKFSNNKTLEGHSNRVNSIAFNEELQILASGSDDKTIRVWNLTKFTCMQILTGHTDCVYNVLFTKDSRWLTSSSKDHTIRTWDLTARSYDISNNSRKRAIWHNNYVYSVAFSPDEQWLASGSRDNSIRLWQVANFKNNKILEDHSELILEDPKDFIYSIMFSLDGKWLAAGGNDGLYLYSTKSLIDPEGSIDKSEMLVKYFNYPARSVAFSANNQLLAIGSKDQKVRIFNLMDLTTNNASKVLEGHAAEVYSVAFSYDGNWLASGGEDHKVFIWDVKDWANAVVYKIFTDHSNCVDSIAFSLDHNWLASASWDQSIYIYNLKQLDKKQKLGDHTKEVNNLTFSQDSKYLLSGDYCGVLMVWHLCGLDNNVWKNILKIRTGFNVFCIAYSNYSKFVATGGSDCSVRVWVHEHDQLTLLNSTHQSILCAEQLDISGARLSANSRQLLEQRGAFGEAIIDDLIEEEQDLVTLPKAKMLLFSDHVGEAKKPKAEESGKIEETVNFNHGLHLSNI